MPKFIVGTFLILGWTFFVLSGGSDFVPEERVADIAEDVLETPVIEVTEVVVPEAVEEPVVEVARADTSSVLDLSTGALLQPAVAETATVDVNAEAVTVALAALDQVEDPIEVAEESLAPLDLRQVAGSRVNMRAGPGTGFDVLATLPGGTEAEVMEVDATGWARIRITDSGAIGWMAERLLTES